MFMLRGRRTGAMRGVARTSAAIIGAAIALLPSGTAQAQVAVDSPIPGAFSDFLCVEPTGTVFVIDGFTAGGCNVVRNPAVDGSQDVSTLTFGGQTSIGTGGVTTSGTITSNDGAGNSTTIANQVVTVTSATTGTTTIDGGNVTTQNLTVNGTTTTNGINNSGAQITNVGDPIDPLDAANKQYVDAGLNAAFKEIDETKEGIAVAIALGGIALPQGKNFAIAGNLGFYDSKEAFAAQTAIRLDQNITFNGGVGVGFEDSKVGGRVGIMAAW
jgi:hypothetical protein